MGKVVEFLKPVEYQLYIFGNNADTGILYIKLDPLLKLAEPHRNTPLRREYQT